MSFWDFVSTSLQSTDTSASIDDEKELARAIKAIHYLFVCGEKLRAHPTTLATAALIYHNFTREASHSGSQYEPWLTVCSSIYLAGKCEEEKISKRNVVNVCYSTANPDAPLLKIDSKLTELMETVGHFEMFIMRMIKFQVQFNHPHLYLVHYLKSLRDWIGPSFEDVPIARTSWGLLKDTYHHPTLVVDHPPEHLAVTVVYMALEVHGLHVPLEREAEVKWWNVFDTSITPVIIQAITTVILDTYMLGDKAIKAAAVLHY